MATAGLNIEQQHPQIIIATAPPAPICIGLYIFGSNFFPQRRTFSVPLSPFTFLLHIEMPYNAEAWLRQDVLWPSGNWVVAQIYGAMERLVSHKAKQNWFKQEIQL